MSSRWIALIFMFFTFTAHAGWAFKAFKAAKVQTQSSGPWLVLADQDCLERLRRADKHQRDSLYEIGLLVQHNASPGVAALRAFTRPGFSPTFALDALASHECVHGVTDDGRTQIAAADPNQSSQLALPAISFASARGLFAHPLWGVREDVVVGIIDTGVELTHPDLRMRMWRGANGAAGRDFVNLDDDPTDDSGHGTHVAGIVAAESANGVGIAGVSGARIMAIKTQGPDGGGNMSDMVNAIRWAADNGADVINLSLTSSLVNPALEDAIQYAIAQGAVIAAASGNDGRLITATNFLTPIGYAKDYAGLIGVGSFDALTFARSSFSNYSPTYVELGAPGSAGSDGIFSTYLGGGYRGNSGTSMASPHVAGAAALTIGFWKTRGIPYTPADVERAIAQAAESDGALTTVFQSGRRLDLERLGRMLFYQTVIDGTGGFDDP